MFLPESPKFLMTTGRNEKALTIFRKVYRINTGEPEDSFPVNIANSCPKKYCQVHDFIVDNRIS